MLPLSFDELNTNFKKVIQKNRKQVGMKLICNNVFIVICTLDVKYILIIYYEKSQNLLIYLACH